MALAWTYLLNQSIIIPRYLSLVVWPQSLVMIYGWPQALVLADVWPSAALIVGLFALTVFALIRYPRAGFLGAVFFITLAPTSSFVPIATEAGRIGGCTCRWPLSSSSPLPVLRVLL